MGLSFPTAAIKMAKRVAVTPITAILCHISCTFLTALFRWGLDRLLPQEHGGGGERDVEPSEESSNYILLMDGATPSLVHVNVLIPLIKKRVPVVEYGEFLKRRQHHRRRPLGVAAEEEVADRCAICLVGVEERDEIQELQNCCHVFHRQCLDCWVDLGHVTCPLCRSLLLPPSPSTQKARRRNENFSHHYRMG
ncbi:hypothetical protein SAY87_015303 [Trapa incisa]|uniref:RING-type domain-containing protein n=1 Tax=Trapa incisa TaxID=236973 RepID=A0AAN7JLA5_9MYRT|nr:hypothetical protein SAY87_015303 [Trapa incisa]